MENHTIPATILERSPARIARMKRSSGEEHSPKSRHKIQRRSVSPEPLELPLARHTSIPTPLKSALKSPGSPKKLGAVSRLRRKSRSSFSSAPTDTVVSAEAPTSSLPPTAAATDTASTALTGSFPAAAPSTTSENSNVVPGDAPARLVPAAAPSTMSGDLREEFYAAMMFMGKQSHQQGTQLRQEFNEQGTQLRQEYNEQGMQLKKEFNEQGTQLKREFNEQGAQLRKEFNEHGTQLRQEFNEQGAQLRKEFNEQLQHERDEREAAFGDVFNRLVPRARLSPRKNWEK